jgi:hypothetical protein
METNKHIHTNKDKTRQLASFKQKYKSNNCHRMSHYAARKKYIHTTIPPPPKGSWKPKYRMRNWTERRNSNGAVVVALVALAIATDLT